ncbi:MAG TPA: hypothetical protein VEI49_14350, partial [Terriglobales bacterium]|nr:hypothetical protein [Terriglobales bacterium]
GKRNPKRDRQYDSTGCVCPLKAEPQYLLRDALAILRTYIIGGELQESTPEAARNIATTSAYLNDLLVAFVRRRVIPKQCWWWG